MKKITLWFALFSCIFKQEYELSARLEVDNQFKQLETAEIPITQPVTAEQFKMFCEKWPANLRPAKVETNDNAEIRSILEKLDKGQIVVLNGKNDVVFSELIIHGYPLHRILKAIELLAERVNEGKLGEEQYLMSGLKVISYWEPCAMCGMALVHSRIDSLFFKERSINGAFGSKVNLLDLQNLNYEFSVYTFS